MGEESTSASNSEKKISPASKAKRNNQKLEEDMELNEEEEGEDKGILGGFRKKKD